MHATIINDCRDANVIGRQVARLSSLLSCPVSYVPVGGDFSDAGELEASGNLIDMLDAYGEAEAVVLVNAAPRGGKGKKWPNGTPFGYFTYKNVLVVSSVDGYTLSLVKKFALTDAITVLDIPTALKQMVVAGAVSADLQESIANSQFRSFDFLPRAGAFLAKGATLSGESLPMIDVPDAQSAVWFVDNFGNSKTTLFVSDVSVQGGSVTTSAAGVLPFFERLKDVPDKTSAIIVGSSGIGTKRFLEIVVQGGNAAQKFGLKVGSVVL